MEWLKYTLTCSLMRHFSTRGHIDPYELQGYSRGTKSETHINESCMKVGGQLVGLGDLLEGNKYEGVISRSVKD